MANAHVFTSADMDGPETFEIAGGQVLFYSRRCPGKETPNEDSLAFFGVSDDVGVLVVADGMGGEEAGHVASAIAVKAVVRSLEEMLSSHATVRSAVLDGIEQANREILQLGVGAATTIAVAEIQSGSTRAYHVGDSPIAVLNANRHVKAYTIAHSPVGYAVEAGVLDDAEAMLHPERHVVSNYLGSEKMRIEVGPVVPYSPGDTVLLSSDGLGDNLSLDEVTDAVCNQDLMWGFEALLRATQERMNLPFDTDLPSKPDDLTIVAHRRS